MLAVFLLFIVLSSGAMLGCFVLEKEYKFGEYVPVSCMAAVLVLFVFGLFKALSLGFWLLVAVCAFTAVAAVVKIIKSDTARSGKKNFFSPGFWVYILLFASVVWINYDMQAHDWDEFSHWALVVKEMNAVNVLPSNPAVRFTFYKTYPPAMPLFEYFVLKLNGGVFTEWLLYAAYQIFLLSLFMPFIERLDFSKWYNWLFVPAMWLAPLVFYDNVYEGLYVDAFLGVLSGTCLAAIVDKEADSRLQKLFIFFGVAVLTLAKEIGIYFAACIALEYVVSERKAASIWAAAVAALPKLLWKSALKLNGVTGQTRGEIDWKAILNLINGGEDIFRRHIIGAFMYLFKVYFLLPFIIIGIALLFVLLKKKRFDVWILIMVQTVLYFAGMLLLYMFILDYREGSALASFDRYIGIAFEAMLVCLIICCTSLHWKYERLSAIGVLLLVLVMTPYGELYNTISRRNIFLAASIRQPVEEAYCRTIRDNYEPGSRICYGSGEKATMEFFESRYILAPDYDVYWYES